MKRILMLITICISFIIAAPFNWTGANGDYRVETGFGDVSDTYGYWYSYTDADNEGTSTLTWKTTTGNEYNSDALDPVIDACGGLCGSITLGAGYDYPFVGIGFNIVGESKEGVDVTSWEGICIVYEATSIAPILELGVENEDTYTQYNNYKATLSLSETTANLPWSKFKQDASWGILVNQTEYLTHVNAIKIKFDGKAGTTGTFNIKQIGSYGNCTNSNTVSIKTKQSSTIDIKYSNNMLTILNPMTELNIFNVNGELVYSNTSKTNQIINMSKFPKGIYLVNVNSHTTKIKVE